MIDCLIIGEAASVEVISGFIKEQCKFTVKNTTSTYTDLSLINPLRPCLVYIDAQIVIEHYKELLLMKQQHCFIILHSEFGAIDAFKELGIGYLSMPITLETFKYSLIQFGEYLLGPLGLSHSLMEDLDHLDMKVEDHGSKIKRIFFKDLIYIKAFENYIELHLENTKVHLNYNTMCEIEKRLPSKYFLRVHRGYIINISKMISIDGNFIWLDNELYKIPVGRKYMHRLKNTLSSTLIKKPKGKRGGSKGMSLCIAIGLFSSDLLNLSSSLSLY